MVTDNLNQENKKGTSRTKQLLLAGFSGLIILCMAVFILLFFIGTDDGIVLSIVQWHD